MSEGEWEEIIVGCMTIPIDGVVMVQHHQYEYKKNDHCFIHLNIEGVVGVQHPTVLV